MSALSEDIDAKARAPLEFIAAITSSAMHEFTQPAHVGANDVHRDLLGLVRRQRCDMRLDIRYLKFAISLDLKRPAYGEVEIGDPLMRFQHVSEDGVEFGAAHE